MEEDKKSTITPNRAANCRLTYKRANSACLANRTDMLRPPLHARQAKLQVLGLALVKMTEATNDIVASPPDGFLARRGGDVSSVLGEGGTPSAATPKWKKRGHACQLRAGGSGYRDVLHNIQ